ncbi:oxidoreductase, FAD-dependent, partial [Plesiocystis pacifica SIR-1]
MITVVGAGIVGAACARALVRGGAAVRVIDARAPGTGASAEGMGHVLALDHDPPTLALSHRSLELWHALAPALPQSAEWSGAGTLWLARTPDELERAWDEAEGLRGLGLRVERLDNDAARALEPCLSPTLAGALRVADDRVVYPPVVAAWMLAQARESGAEVTTGVGVRSLEPADQGERVVLDDGRALECEAVVLATGLGTGALLPADSPLRAAIRPRRGHLIITERLPTAGALSPLARLRHQLVELGYHDSVATRGATSVAFNLQPRSTGQLLLGSSRQDMDPSLPLAALKAIDADTLGRMVARAQPFVPALGQAR